MSCLKLQAGTLKQCLHKEDGHPGDCFFTLLRPEVAQAEDRRKTRDNELVRRQVAEKFISEVLRQGVALDWGISYEPEHVVKRALEYADELVAKTGGFGP